MRTTYRSKLLAGAMFWSLVGCAVQQSPAQLTPKVSTGNAQQRVLAQELALQLDTGYQRILKQGSRWTHIGRIAQGEVYQPFNSVLTIEGAHIHEAYLVVEQGAVSGFFLPAEGSFSPLKQHPIILFQ